MKTKHGLALAAALGIYLAPDPGAAAQLSEYTVKQLVEPCIEGDNDARWGVFAELECEQYINGVMDAYGLFAADKPEICLPDHPSRADAVRRAFVKWAYDHYDARDQPAAQGLMQALKDKFPCQH